MPLPHPRAPDNFKASVFTQKIDLLSNSNFLTSKKYPPHTFQFDLSINRNVSECCVNFVCLVSTHSFSIAASGHDFPLYPTILI